MISLTSQDILNELEHKYKYSENDTVIYFKKILTRMIELEDFISEKISKEDLRQELVSYNVIEGSAEDE